MQHFEEYVKGTQYESKFRSRMEQENLLSNLVSLRRTHWELRANLYQLEELLEKSRSLKDEADCLREQLNSLGENLGLQPLTGGEA